MRRCEADRFLPARLMQKLNIDIADRCGSVFLLRLRLAERFSDAAMRRGSRALKTSSSRSSASLSVVTLPDHRGVEAMHLLFRPVRRDARNAAFALPPPFWRLPTARWSTGLRLPRRPYAPPGARSLCFDLSLPRACRRRRLCVDGRPGASHGLSLGHAALLIAFGDVVSLALLLAGVFRFVAARHR
jgi:hypothetical protein